jgi:hypothetical protein
LTTTRSYALLVLLVLLALLVQEVHDKLRPELRKRDCTATEGDKITGVPSVELGGVFNLREVEG